MTAPIDDPTVQAYERRAVEAEHSPLLVLLKIGRGIVWALYALTFLTAILLTTAFFLRLFGANPESSFVEWVYRSTQRAMRPFRGIFPTRNVGGASVLDMSYLFAAIFYFVMAMLVDAGHRWLTRRVRHEEWEAGQARARADSVAQQALAQQQADLAARSAAARAYASQQAAAAQYATPRVAAQQVFADQPATPSPSQPSPSQPSPSQPAPTDPNP